MMYSGPDKERAMPVEPRSLKELFLAALAIGQAERATWLDRECGPDADLRRRLELLLAAHDTPQSLLDRLAPAAEPPAATDHFSAAAEHPSSAGRDEGSTVVAGRYKLLQQIGEGGMGTVWVAEQLQPVRRKVAVKLIKVGMDSKTVLARFEAERQALAVMDHPNIAKVLDGGLTEAGRPFFVMEYVKGVSITEYCEATRLSVPERVRLFAQVCQAVQHAHQKGIIHRDLKPSNILVAPYDDKPVPKVIDFGLAKALHGALTDRTLHTAHGMVLGTPLYMSPEQAHLNNLDVDTRSDVYTLGVLLYELLTGSTPLERQRFLAAAWDEVCRVIREEEPPRPSTRLSSSQTLPSVAASRQTEPARLTKMVRGELDWIVMKALEKDRSRRYDTANSLALDIQRYLAGEPVLAAPPSARYRLRKFAHKHRTALTTAATISVLLVAGAAVSTWQAVRATRAEQVETQRAEGERLAKQDAERAAAAATSANEQAQKRLRQIEKANDLLGSIFENLNPQKIAEADRPLQAILVENLDKAVAQLEGESIGEPLVVAAMQNRFAISLMSLGELGKAVVLLEKARATRQAELGPDHPDTLTTVSNLALAYEMVGKHDLALPLLEETLKLTKARLGPDHPDTLNSMGGLAHGYQAVGKMDLALPLFEETLKLCKAKLGPDHRETLIIMHNLAVTYKAAGKLDLALPLFEETLRIKKAKLVPDHPETLTTMNQLAQAYEAAGKQDLALPLLEEVLKLRRARLGPDHPRTITSLNKLATAYLLARKLDLAVPLLEDALRLCKARRGPDHPDTLTIMNNLAVAYRRVGKSDLAVPIFEELLKRNKARNEPDHPDTLRCMHALAVVYQDTGKLDLAQPLFEELLKLTKAKLGPDHPDTRRSMEDLDFLRNLGTAEERYRVNSAKLGPDHIDTLLARRDLAQLYLATNRLDQAERMLVELIDQMKTRANDDPIRVFTIRLLRKCLTKRERTVPDFWLTFRSKSLLGGALLGQKKYTDAEPLLLAGYEGMKKQEAKLPPEAKAGLTEAVERLVQLYEATEKKDQAAKWRKELEALRTRVNVPETKP
jgi:serine/threonine protein kinase/tetratricopeptide (TPR) repeat protein